MKINDYVISCQDEVMFYPFTYCGSFGSPSYDVAGFRCKSNSMLKYKKWLGTDNAIFRKPFIKKISAPLSYCEQLFGKNVLEIKKLVKDIGDLTPPIHKEQNKFFSYDDSNIIANTFFTEFNKKIQCYGFISLEYNHDNEKRINSRKGLSFKMKHNIKKEFLTLQLEDISTPKKLRQTIRK